MAIKIIAVLLFLSKFIFCIQLDNIFYREEMDIKDVALADVLAELSKKSGITIVSDKSSKGEIVDAYFKENSSLEHILKTLENSYGLQRRVEKNSIIISGKDLRTGHKLAGRILDRNSKVGIGGARVKISNFQNKKVITLKNGSYFIEDISPGIYMVFAEAENYISDGEFVEIKDSVTKQDIYLTQDFNTLNFNIKEKEGTINNFEKNVIIEHITLKNISSEEMKKTLHEIFGNTLVVGRSPRGNGIILRGNREQVQHAKELIDRIDLGYNQVRVSAEIIDITDNLFQELGFDWLYTDSKSFDKKHDGLDIGILNKHFLDGIGNFYGSTIRLIRKFNDGNDILGLGISLLKGTQDLKTSALPSIILLSGKEGEFKMVEEVIVGEIQQEDDETGKTLSTPLFKEAGIILKVLPEIKDGNNIYLSIWLEVSDFKLRKPLKKEEDSNDGTFNSHGGSKVSRSLVTSVRVKNGEAIFIGGLKRSIEQSIKSQLPFLGDIPYLGIIFKSKAERKEKTDLYIKLKADIIENNSI